MGPGAHSRLGDYRFWTVLSPRDYNIKAASWADSDVSPMDQMVDDADGPTEERDKRFDFIKGKDFED